MIDDGLESAVSLVRNLLLPLRKKTERRKDKRSLNPRVALRAVRDHRGDSAAGSGDVIDAWRRKTYVCTVCSKRKQEANTQNCEDIPSRGPFRRQEFRP